MNLGWKLRACFVLWWEPSSRRRGWWVLQHSGAQLLLPPQALQLAFWHCSPLTKFCHWIRSCGHVTRHSCFLLQGGVSVLPLQTCLAPWQKAIRNVLLDPLLPALCLLWAWHDLPGQPLPLHADCHTLPQKRVVVEGTPEGAALHSSSSSSFRIFYPLICPIPHGPTGTVHFCHLLWQQIPMPIMQRNVFLHLL